MTATLQGKCTVQSHYNRVSYSEENIEGVQVQTLDAFEIKKQLIYLRTCMSRWPHLRSSLQKMLLDNTCTLAHIHVLHTCINLKCGARQRTVAHSGKTHLLNSLCDFYTGTLAVSVPMRNTCTQL